MVQLLAGRTDRSNGNLSHEHNISELQPQVSGLYVIQIGSRYLQLPVSYVIISFEKEGIIFGLKSRTVADEFNQKICFTKFTDPLHLF